MKKILKTLAKKSMSVFLAVVMLMTCWVWFVPEKAEAAYTEIGSVLNSTRLESFKNFIGASSVSTSVTTKTVSTSPFAGDSSINSSLYKNILYTGKMTGEGSSVNSGSASFKGADSIAVHYPLTVVLEDGKTIPQFGISLHKDAASDYQLTHWGTSLSGSGFGLVENWGGTVTDSYSTQIFYEAYKIGDKTKGATTTGTTSSNNTHQGDKGKWYWLANLVKYEGNLGEDYQTAYYGTSITPTIKSHLHHTANGCDNPEETSTVTYSKVSPIYVVNVRPWKAAVEHAARQYLNILTYGENRYTATSVQNFKTYAAALFKVGPDAYFSNVTDDTGAVNAVNSFASENKAAVVNYYTNGQLVEASYTVKFVDWDGTVLKTQTGLSYGASATAPSNPTRAYDSANHYTFSGWSGSYSNITGDVTVTAQYTATAHTHTGAFSYKDGTHARKCSGCASIGWNGTDGLYVACDGTWGGTDSSHTKPCSVCGNTQTHTPQWQEVIDTKYQAWTGNLNPCLDDEVYYKSCSICGQAHSSATFVGKKAPGSHNYDTFTGHTNHTCTEDGYDTYLCSTCGQASEKRYDTVNGQPGTDPAAHNWNNKLAVYSDTQHGYQCRNCGEWDTASLADHSYSAPSGSAIQTRPTCYQEGWGTYKCSCGYTYDGAIPATGSHNWNTNKLVEIDENVHGYKCRTEGCPAYQIADDGSEKHVWTLTSTITEPTCMAAGSGNYKCDICGAVKVDSIPVDPTAHNHDTVISDLGNGYHGYKCLNAPGDASHAKDAEKHTYGDDEVYTEDETKHGVKCTVCNSWNQDSITIHVWVLTETLTAPTCSAEGTGKYECLCGAEKVDAIEADPNAHSYGDIVDLGDGTHGKVCAHNSSHKIEVADHIWVLDSVITAQTCIDNGLGTYKCLCGATKEDIIAADGKSHKYLDPVSDGNGKHTATCDYCKDNIDEACFDNDKNCECDVCGYDIPHSYVNKVDEDYIVSAADCNSYAVYYKSCEVCGTAHATETFEDVDGGYADHKWENTEGKLATERACGVDETYYKYCSECGKYADEVDHHIPAEKTWTKTGTALEHNYTAKADNSNIVCNNDGTHKYYCQNGCGTTGGSVDCKYGDYSYDDNNHYRECDDCGYIETNEHSLTEWKYDDADEEHKHGKHCTVCEYKISEACEYKEEYEPAVCGRDAYTTYTCQVESCGHYYTEIHQGTALEHIFEAEEGYIVNNEDGTHSFKCQRDCGAVSEPVACEISYTQNEDNLNHTALCGVCGYTKQEACAGGTAFCNKLAVCDLCKEEYGVFNPDNHGIDEGINTTRRDNEVEATCVIPGHTADVVCDGCNAVLEKGADLPVNPDNHKNFTGTMSGTLPTCTEAGYADSKYCLDCSKSIGDGVIPALGHKFDGEIVKGVDADGIEYHEYKCTTALYKLADGTVTTELPAEGTDYEVVYSCDAHGKREACYGGEATCSDLAECKVCGQAYGEYSAHNFNGDYKQVESTKEHNRKCEYCDAYGLDGEEGKTAKCTGFFATCEEESKCEVCGGIYMAALGHDFVNSEVVNCLNNGKHNFKCLRCDVVSEEFECADAKPVKTEATCTEAAYYTYVCDDCGYKWVVESTDPADAAKGHDYSEVQTNAAHLVSAATCTEKAVYWYDCSRCTKNAKDEADTEKYTDLTFEYGEPAGHKYDGKEYLYLATEATCTENETYFKHCSACADKPTSEGTEFEATFEKFGTKIEHDWQKVADEDYLVSEATCTSKAVYNVSCGNCDAVGTSTFTYGDILDHSFTEKIINYAHIVSKANCQTAATYWYDCATCSMSASLEAPEMPVKTDDLTDEAYAALVEAYEAELVALQFTAGEKDPDTHTKLTKVPALLPTCTVNGHSAYEECECGKKFGYKEEGYGATGHDFTGNYTFNEETDKHTRLCANGCGTADENEVACTFSKWTQVAGTETHTRSCVCGNTETVACEAEGEAPSCVERARCKYCQGYVGETSEHNKADEWTYSDETVGYHVKICTVCEEVLETQNCYGGTATCGKQAECEFCHRGYGKTPDHTYGEWIDDAEKPATCTEAKWQYRYCTVCKAEDTKQTQQAGKPLGHNISDWYYATEEDKPTCKDEGLMTKTCSRCDLKETKVVPVDLECHEEYIANEIGRWEKEEGAADCVNGVVWYLYCNVCDKKLDSKIESGEHQWKKIATVAATCLADGYITYECDVCHFTKTEYPEDLKSEGHAWGEEIIDKQPTCGAAGRAYKLCSKCNAQGEKYAIPATGHGPSVDKELKYTIIVEPVAATCTSTGHNGYWKCKRCSYDEHLDENSDYKVYPKLPHSDTDGDGLCDECHGKIYSDDSGSNKSCGCMCHNDSFLMQFFYKIAKFFWKLFGTNKSCDCGYEHY